MNGPLVRVRLPDRRELVLHGLRSMLDSERERIEIVGGESPGEVPAAADVEILDATACRDDPSALVGLGTGAARRQVVLVDEDAPPQLVRRALGLGAAGLVTTSESAGFLVDALVRAAGGAVVLSPGLEAAVAAGTTRWPGEDRGLSRRESQVLVLISGGRSPEDIARVLGIAHETVRSHLKRVYHKLGVRDRAGAVAKAWNEGVVDKRTVAADGADGIAGGSTEAAAPTG